MRCIGLHSISRPPAHAEGGSTDILVRSDHLRICVRDDHCTTPHSANSSRRNSALAVDSGCVIGYLALITAHASFWLSCSDLGHSRRDDRCERRLDWADGFDWSYNMAHSAHW